MTTIKVHADRPGARINPAMWGIFFEDINFGADGGLCAELVKNRGFEFPDPLMGWTKIAPSLAQGELSVRTDQPSDPANPHYVRIQSRGSAPFGLSNEGFRGMGLKRGEAYEFSVQVRAVEGSPRLRVELYGGDGSLLDSVELSGFSSDWKPAAATLRPNATDPKGRLCLLVEGEGTIDVDKVSLVPRETWKRRPRGLRADMVRMLADLKPGFLRFPGGCIVEGSVLERRYQWKDTLGPVDRRKLLINRWNYEFLHRPTPDYFQSFGLGFFEFFQLCEDIGAEPLPILNCGMACQFNSGELVPLDRLQPYIQDALDLIEFANGNASTQWGGRRAALGHPAPFHLKMLGVGNEQWGPQYLERYAAFAKVLKEKHPQIQLVAAAGPSPADDRFQFLWPGLRELKADIVDEHCYANPVWFFANTRRYDRYDRNGPKVFMGEYAAQSVAIVSTKNRNDLDCALAEAAYMTGLERNADVVRMSSYAPLFAHAEAWQWTPNLVWCDNLRAYATPSYYVQQLFSHNRGDVVLPVDLAETELPSVPSGRVGLGTFLCAAEFKDVRVTRGEDILLNSDFAKGAGEWSGGGKRWTVVDGAYQQTDHRTPTSVFAGDPAWSDYTLSLKARKLSGSGSLGILVRQVDPENYIAWILGGADNHFHRVQFHLGQQDELLSQVEGEVETGRWYEAKIELKGTKLACYLDGTLVQSVDVPPPQFPMLYASAVRDEKAGEVILKVVNPGAAPRKAEIQLAGIAGGAREIQAVVLTGAGPGAENSFERPFAVAPVESAFDASGDRFDHTFAQHSMTVLRIKTR